MFPLNFKIKQSTSNVEQNILLNAIETLTKRNATCIPKCILHNVAVKIIIRSKIQFVPYAKSNSDFHCNVRSVQLGVYP